MIEKYKYSDAELKKLLKTIEIVIDTREKQAGHIFEWLDKNKIGYRIEKLDFGDFSFMLPKNEEFNIPRDLYFNNDIVVERKGSLNELAGNFAKDRARLEEEFATYKGRMYLMIEGCVYSDIMKHNYKSQYNVKAFAATLHTFVERYDIRYLFVPNKMSSGQIIAYTFYYYLRNKLKK